jgi:hypothetical protein
MVERTYDSSNRHCAQIWSKNARSEASASGLTRHSRRDSSLIADRR